MGLFSRKNKKKVPSSNHLTVAQNGPVSMNLPISQLGPLSINAGTGITVYPGGCGGGGHHNNVNQIGGNGGVGVSGQCISGAGSYTIGMGTAVYGSIMPGAYSLDVIAGDYFDLFIDEIFPDKTSDFRLEIKEIFDGKDFYIITNAIRNIFSNDGLEFLEDMSDEEIINYLKITI